MSAYTEADVDRLAQVIDNAREAGIHHGNYTLARWILDRWPVEETGRRWVFPLDSKADVVMPNGVHVYWSTHCRHGNHADCKGSCKICGSPCLCAGCTHQQVEGSTPIASPAPADDPAPVPPPVDALRGVIEAARIYGRLAYADGRDDNDPEKSAVHWPAVKRAAQALWAAGVEEGRQQSAGQLKKERESFGRLALLYDGAVSDGEARYAAGVAEGRRQATEERTKVEYGVRVDAVHPLRREKVGTVMTHFGEQKSRMCHDIWDGWTPVKRTVRPAVHGQWEALDEAERLRAPWKRDAEAADHG